MQWQSFDIVLTVWSLHSQTAETRELGCVLSSLFVLFINTFQGRLNSNVHLEKKERTLPPGK